MGEHKLRFAGKQFGYHPSWDIRATHSTGPESAGWPAQLLRLNLASRWDFLQRSEMRDLDEHMAALVPHPFPGLASALDFVGTSSDLNLRSGLNVYFPTYARIATSRLNRSKSILSMNIQSFLDPVSEQMAMTVGFRGAGIPPTSVNAVKWSDLKAGAWRVDLKVPPDTGWVDLALVARRRNISRNEAFAPSLATFAFAQVPGSLDWLLGLLSAPGTKPQSQDFERGIVALLALGRIPALPMGHKGPNNSFDVLGFADDQRIIVGECSVVEPSSDKLDKLMGRANQLQARLGQFSRGVRVLPVVFMPSNLESVSPTTTSMARERRIHLVWGSQLAKLAQDIQAGTTPADTFDSLRSSSRRRIRSSR